MLHDAAVTFSRRYRSCFRSLTTGCGMALLLLSLTSCGSFSSAPSDNYYDNIQYADDIPQSANESDLIHTISEDTVVSDNSVANYAYSSHAASYTNSKKGTAESETPVMTADDRYVYQEGFFYQSLTPDVKERINGLSYKEDCTVPYEDLRYVSVLYEDFDGNTQIGEIICNQAIAQDLVEIFYELYCNHYQIDKIRLVDEYDADDDLSCADNNTSCFNFRKVYGSDNLSKHALGLAIDINPFQNPYITYPDGVERISPAGSEPYADRTSGLAHMITEEDLCYQLFTAHGFTWGGHWKTLKDYQHFQKEV
jgi:hypothetical protein